MRERIGAKTKRQHTTKLIRVSSICESTIHHQGAFVEVVRNEHNEPGSIAKAIVELRHDHRLKGCVNGLEKPNE
jgi:hypothetical protein